MISNETDAAESMRQMLQADLRSAMKGRAASEIGVLRGLIAAIDNAGAVPLSARSGPTQSEVERRRLSAEDVQQILQREYEVRQTAAVEFTRLGLAVEAERSNREMAVVSRYLTSRR